MSQLIVFCFVFFISRVTSEYYLNSLIVWNVGQGQWVSFVSQDECIHIDMGGETWPKNVVYACSNKINAVYLSHWDFDHIRFVLKASKILSAFCIIQLPEAIPRTRFQQQINKLGKCQRSASLQRVTEVKWKKNGKKSNVLSRVFVISKTVLISGDSPKGQEMKWAKQVQNLPIRLLVLGHHGSRTSTSSFLMSQLPQLQLGISSSRFARYGHPHVQVVRRFKEFKIPLIRTEDWGDIKVELRQFQESGHQVQHGDSNLGFLGFF